MSKKLTELKANNSFMQNMKGELLMIGIGYFLLILLFVLCVIVISYIFDKYKLMIILIILSFVWIVLGIAALCISENVTINITDFSRHEYDMVSLATNSEIKYNSRGSFVLGCGGFNSSSGEYQYYYTMINVEEKGVKFQKYNVSDVYIKEDSNIPYIEGVYKKINYEYYPNLFVGGIFKCQENSEYYRLQYYVFHVPEGTILTNYSVDVDNFE